MSEDLVTVSMTMKECVKIHIALINASVDGLFSPEQKTEFGILAEKVYDQCVSVKK